MLELAEKLTRSPWLAGERDRESLRAAGLSEREILHVVLGCAVFNYLNRMADGLGIELEYKSDLPAFKVAGEARAAAPPDAQGTWPAVSASGSLEEPHGLFEAMSDNPDARDRTREWRRHQLEATPGLGARVRARIGFHVSSLNGCGYCASWFERRLEELAVGPSPPSSIEKVLLAHAERLTREPWTTRRTHIDALRAASLDDAAILRLTMLASYVNFENRVAAGLGVELGARS